MRLYLILLAIFVGSFAGGRQGARPSTVMVLDMEGDGWQMTSKEDGVRFDLDRTGERQQLGWTVAGSDDVFLALDLNDNGTIDDGGEMLGARLHLPGDSVVSSGADVLMNELQGIVRGPDGKPSGPLPRGAGRIDADDQVFQKLLLWSDANHDGISQAGELRHLKEAGVTAIRNGYRRTTLDDGHGNLQRLLGTFLVNKRGVDFQRAIAEVVPAK